MSAREELLKLHKDHINNKKKIDAFNYSKTNTRYQIMSRAGVLHNQMKRLAYNTTDEQSACFMNSCALRTDKPIDSWVNVLSFHRRK